MDVENFRGSHTVKESGDFTSIPLEGVRYNEISNPIDGWMDCG